MRVERQSVLEAATRLFTVNPRASTQDVAAAAGISRATLHRLFPSRDALIAGLGLLAIDRIREAYASARLDEDPVPEALARLITALEPVVHQFAYLVGETQLHQNDAVMAGDRVVEEETERLLRRGQAEGTLRTDLPVVWMSHTLAGLLLAAEEAVRLGNIAPRDASRLILESFLGGAGSRVGDAAGISARRGPPLHLDLRDPAVRASIYATYARLRGEDPVAPAILTVSDQDEADFTGTLGREIFLATGYEDALDALTDDRFAIDGLAVMTDEQRAGLPPMPDEFRPLMRNLLSIDPPDHTRLRRLVQPSFTPRTMEAMRPRIQAIADELLDAAEAAAAARGETAPNRTLELIDAYAYPLPMTVISELLGVPMADRPQVRVWSEALIASQGLTEEIRIVLVDFAAYLRQLFAEKRRQPADDLTSQLVHAEEEGDKLDDDELLSMVFILIVAGHVTTVNLIGNAVLALLTHPDQLARLRANPALVAGAVEETLRYWGPVEMAAPRFARDDLEFAGTTIPRGRPVLPVLAAADRDPERFAEPDRFDIERPDANRHVAFGKGVHLCLEAPLARVEGQVAVDAIFRRLPHLRLAEPRDEPLVNPSLFRGPERLPLLF